LCEDFFDGWTTVQLLDDRLRIDVPGRQDAPDVFERSATPDRVDLEIGTGPRRQLGVLATRRDDSWKGVGWGTLRSRMQDRVVYGRVEETTLRGGTQAVLGHRTVTEGRGSAVFLTVLHEDGSMTDVSITVRAEDHDHCDTLIMKMYRTVRLGDAG